jgi:serine/threonine protein phosphatase PrpC
MTMKKIIISLLTFCAAVNATLLNQPKPVYNTTFEISQDQNAREYMEDRFIADQNIQLFGVFDGHGGQATAQYLATNFANIFEPILSNQIAMERCSTNPYQDYHNAFNYSFAKIEKQLWDKHDEINEYGYTSVYPFLGLKALMDEKYGQSGATAIVAKRVDNTVIIANVGDSRAALIRNNKIIHSTHDHKPNDPQEKERIEKAGGTIELCGGCWRVCGFALSRSIGDIFAKQQAGQTKDSANPIISAVPDMYQWQIQPGDILILATDGLWDAMDSTLGSNDNARLQELLNEEIGIQMILAQRLLEEAKRRGSKDNITVLTVQF